MVIPIEYTMINPKQIYNILAGYVRNTRIGAVIARAIPTTKPTTANLEQRLPENASLPSTANLAGDTDLERYNRYFPELHSATGEEFMRKFEKEYSDQIAATMQEYSDKIAAIRAEMGLTDPRGPTITAITIVFLREYIRRAASDPNCTFLKRVDSDPLSMAPDALY